jgi:hypothetical protein
MAAISEGALDVAMGYYQGGLSRLLEGLQAAGLEGAVIGVDGDANVGDSEIWVSRRLASDKVEALRAALGEDLRPTRRRK